MAFYSVSQAGEEITVLENDRDTEGYPWSVALPSGSMLQDLEVAVQSTQVAIDSRGVIINRKGFGQGCFWIPRMTWEELWPYGFLARVLPAGPSMLWAQNLLSAISMSFSNQTASVR